MLCFFVDQHLPFRRPVLEAVLRRLLPRLHTHGSSSSSISSPQVLLLASPAAAATAQRLCATLPQLGGRAVVADLAGELLNPADGHRAAVESDRRQEQEQRHLLDSQARSELDVRQQQQPQHQHQWQQQRMEQQQQERGGSPLTTIVVPQHLILAQLAVVVRRHLVGRRWAKVVVEFRWGQGWWVCGLVFMD